MSRATFSSAIALVITAAPEIASAAEPVSELPSFGGLLLQAVVSLAFVSLLAYLVVRFGLAKWLGARQPDPEHLSLIASMPLGGRRTIYLVRALDRVLVVGASEAGMSALADLGEGSAGQIEGAQIGGQSDEAPRSEEDSAREV